MWATIQIVLGLLGVLLALGGSRLSQPMATSAGITCFALASVAIGWEAILTRKIVLGSRLRGTRQTYSGAAAILQGILFNLLGLFLISLTAVIHLNNGRELLRYFARRPGLLLLLFGALCLMQAVISFAGSLEDREGPRWMVILNLLASRRLPALILGMVGVGATALGFFEIIAPDIFDQMGGGVLEMLYGRR